MIHIGIDPGGKWDKSDDLSDTHTIVCLSEKSLKFELFEGLETFSEWYQEQALGLPVINSITMERVFAQRMMRGVVRFLTGAGDCHGVIRTLTGIKPTLVSANSWRAFYIRQGFDSGKDHKKNSVAWAEKIWPGLDIKYLSHGKADRAEALLIAYYGLNKWMRTEKVPIKWEK
jgi:hypothetical protein